MSKFGTKITFQLYNGGIHTQTHICRKYKINQVTGDPVEDIFKSCRSLKELKETLLLKEKNLLISLFKECDFILFKVNKRNFSVFQKILKSDILNSVRFIKGDL